PLPLLTHLFLYNTPATTHIYTLSLHDALPISKIAPEIVHRRKLVLLGHGVPFFLTIKDGQIPGIIEVKIRVRRFRQYLSCIRIQDRKSTRLNSSHVSISYAVFCLKKKKDTTTI